MPGTIFRCSSFAAITGVKESYASVRFTGTGGCHSHPVNAILRTARTETAGRSTSDAMIRPPDTMLLLGQTTATGAPLQPPVLPDQRGMVRIEYLL